MIFKRRQPGETRIISGFAFIPKSTNKCIIWLQSYKLRQHFDYNINAWRNDYFLST